MIYLLILLVLLQVFDFYSTYMILKKGGKELNPIVDFLIKKVGLFSGLAIAKAVAIGGVIFIYNIDSEYGGHSQIALIILVLVYIYVCFSNYKVLKGFIK